MSQNTKKHQLNSYRDVIMGKPYYEICNRNALKIIYHPWAIYRADKIEWKNDKMDLPDTPVPNYLNKEQISLDSEILQTFVEASNITHVEIDLINSDSDELEKADSHLQIGAYSPSSIKGKSQWQYLMPVADYPWTIFTKEGFKTENNRKYISFTSMCWVGACQES